MNDRLFASIVVLAVPAVLAVLGPVMHTTSATINGYAIPAWVMWFCLSFAIESSMLNFAGWLKVMITGKI